MGTGPSIFQLHMYILFSLYRAVPVPTGCCLEGG